MTELLTDRTWLWIAAVLYLCGFLLGTFSLLRDRRHSHSLMYLIIAAGFVTQTIGLYLRGLEVKGCPIGNTLEVFQFTAWSATALYLLIGATFRLSLLGYFTASLTAALTLISLAVPSWDAVHRVGIFGGNPWIELHATIAIFSYGIFGLLALTCTMYLLQWFSLKRQHLRGFFSFLPSIRDLDHINLRLLIAGVVLLGASLCIGSVYWVQDTATVNIPKLSGAIVVWVAYAITLGLRLRSRLLTRRLAWTCIALFIAALLSLALVNANRKRWPEIGAPAAISSQHNTNRDTHA